MIISISQPAYIPWMGYYDRIRMSDVHVILDNVQYEKGSLLNRNRIISKQGQLLLTVPLQRIFGINTKIDQLLPANSVWVTKHLNSIRQSYSKHPYFFEVYKVLESMYDFGSSNFLLFLLNMNQIFLEKMNIYSKCVRASQLSVTGRKSDLVLNICSELGATEYISGPLGRNYLDEEKFLKNNIAVKYHNYSQKKYTQHGVSDFVSNLSAIDFFFNNGFDNREM